MEEALEPTAHRSCLTIATADDGALDSGYITKFYRK